MILIFSVLVLFFVLSNSKIGSLTIEKSNFLKAFFPYVIILHHVSHLTGGISDFQWAGPYGVGVFFFISGYGLEYKRRHGVLNITSYFKRVKNVLLPIIIPVSIYLILLAINGTHIWQFVIEQLKSYTIVLPYTWFVITLIIIYTSYYSLSYIFPRNLFFSELVFLLLFSCLMMANDMDGTFYITTYCFLIGAIYHDKEQCVMKWQSKTIIVLAIVSFLLLTSVLALYRPLFKGYAAFGASIWTTCFIFLFTRTHVKYTSFINHLKDISYDVFLCQGIAFYLLSKGISLNNVWLYAILSISLSFLFGEFCYYLRKAVMSQL